MGIWDMLCESRMDHIAMDQSQFVNPLAISCYGDEDLATCLQYHWFARFYCFDVCSTAHYYLCKSKVGRIKGFALLAHPNLLSRQVLIRWASYVCVRWLRRLDQTKPKR